MTKHNAQPSNEPEIHGSGETSSQSQCSWVGHPSGSQEWYFFSLDAERLAKCLRDLPRNVKLCRTKATYFLVREIVEFVNRLCPSLPAYANIFVAARSSDETIRIQNRDYFSAHHAALGEASLFIHRLRKRINPKYYLGGTIDSAIVLEEWEPVRKLMLDLLPGPWQKDVECLENRTRRERQTVMEKRRIRPGYPKSGSPELPVVNLELNQVRYRDLCYEVRSDGARFMDKIVKAYPGFFPAYSVFEKPSDVKGKLPEPLRKLIKSEPGKGQYLKLK